MIFTLRRLLFCIVFIYANSLVNAQSWSAAIQLGFANYQGDLAQSRIEFKETKIGTGVFIRRMFDDNWGARVNLITANISGDDNASGRSNRGWSFDSKIREFSVIGEYHPFAKPGAKYGDGFSAGFSPYVFLGLGTAYAPVRLSVPAADASKFPEPNDSDLFFIAPVGIGAVYNLSKYTSVGIEAGWRYPFSDKLDDVSVNGNPNKNDWYITAGINLIVHLRDY